MTTEKMFEKHEDEYLKFERIPIADRDYLSGKLCKMTDMREMKDDKFEVIHSFKNKVMFVCSGDVLLDICEQDNDPIFGEITAEQFHSYGDNPWVEPVSIKRYHSQIVTRVELIPVY